jgi:large subunit ribosomal protein L22
MASPVVDRPGSVAHLKECRMSASKVRLVLNLIRGKRIDEAMEILEYTERLAADPVAKLLASAVANAGHNEDIPADELFVSACFANEGPTMKRFRPRARGRAGRIHKQTCHITIEVSRLTDDELDELRRREELKAESKGTQASAKKSAGGDRAARVAKSKAKAADEEVADDQVDADTSDDQVDEVAQDATDEVAEDAAEEVAEDAAEEVAEDAAAEAAADEADEPETKES